MKNKNSVAEKAISELEDELLRKDPLGDAVATLTLAVATAQLNAPRMHVLPKGHIVVGDLLYIYGNRNKSRACDRYLVVAIDGVCGVASVHLSDRNTSYCVK